MSTLRPSAIITAAFLAGAALAEIGVRATGAFHRDRSQIEATREDGERPRVHRVRTEPAPVRGPRGVAI